MFDYEDNLKVLFYDIMFVKEVMMKYFKVLKKKWSFILFLESNFVIVFFIEILKMCVLFMFYVIKNLFNRDLFLKI